MRRRNSDGIMVYMAIVVAAISTIVALAIALSFTFSVVAPILNTKDHYEETRYSDRPTTGRGESNAVPEYPSISEHLFAPAE